jgi:hypothetical protein
MPAVLRKFFYANCFLNLRFIGGAAVFIATFAVFAQTPPDADLYYRRTHDGQFPPPGVNPSDHSDETTNFAIASKILPAPPVQPKVILDGGIDPANLGKGDWIWQMPATETRLGVSTVQGVIDYEKSLGMQWITVKCGDGGSIWTQFNSDLITRAHTAGLKIFGWAYAYGNNTGVYGSGSTDTANINGEINVALNALALGADGFIIDAEIEYETNATRAADATLYAGTIKSNYPTRFLAHAPFPYIQSHAGFPYIQFGIQCDAVMPQDYWGAIGITPQTMVVNMNTKWITWQSGLTGSNTNAIKPIVPLGQSYSAVTGAQITQFLYALQTNSPKATVAGYNGVSFWDAQERNADMDAAILADGAPSFSAPPLSRVADTGGSVTLAVNAGGNPPLFYQWQFNGANISRATNSTLTIASAQLTNAGNYLCTVTNISGSATSSVASLTIYPPQATVFADNFDANTATNWIINKSSSDNSVAFNFDYSTLGIPSAPHSTNGTTLGAQMKANLTLGVVAALSISPTNQSFSGDYRLHFDAWMNVNGPLPGGPGSTEFLTAGLGTSGTRTEWTGNASADGFYFSADGDGGVSSTSTTTGDYAGYIGSAWQNAASGIYAAGSLDNANAYYTSAFPTGQSAPALQQANFPQQTGALSSGTFGLAWHDVIISRRGSTVNWSVDGILFATISNATFASSNVFVGFWDPFASLSSNNVINFGLVDNVRVEAPAVAPSVSLQPSSQTVKLGTNVIFTVAASGLPSPNFQWQFNGTNISGATNSSYSLAFVAVTNTGNYSVVATNVAGSVTSSNALLALLPPAAAQFQSISVNNAGAVQIGFTGDAVWNYTLEVSTNLTNWNVLTNLTSTNGIFNFIAGSTTNSPQQFYRARVGP